MVWYSHLFKNFPQFVVIHTVIDFSIVNEADVFMEFPCFHYDPMNAGHLMFGSSTLGFPGGSEVKVSAWNVGDPGSILGREDPLEKEMAIHSSTLAWRIPWREEPGRLQSMG